MLGWLVSLVCIAELNRHSLITRNLLLSLSVAAQGKGLMEDFDLVDLQDDEQCFFVGDERPGEIRPLVSLKPGQHDSLRSIHLPPLEIDQVKIRNSMEGESGFDQLLVKESTEKNTPAPEYAVLKVLKSSPYKKDRLTADLLESMLTSIDQQSKRVAKILLTSNLSSIEIHELVAIMAAPDGEKGVTKLLEMLASSSELTPDAYFAKRCIRNLCSGELQVSDHAHKILHLLGSPVSNDVLMIIRETDNETQQAALLGLLNERDLLSYFIEMLQGEGRAVCKLVLDMLSKHDSTSATTLDDTGLLQKFITLLKAPETHQTALAFAKTADNEQQLSKLLELSAGSYSFIQHPSDPKTRARIEQSTAKKICRLLSRADSEENDGKLLSMCRGSMKERAVVRELLDMIPPHPVRDPLDLEKRMTRPADVVSTLADMLLDPSLSRTAEEILINAPPSGRHLLVWAQLPNEKATTDQLLQMLKDPEQAQFARDTLTHLASLDEIAKFLELTAEDGRIPEFGKRSLVSMLYSDLRALTTLLSMLSNEGSAHEHEVGERTLNAICRGYNMNVLKVLAVANGAQEVETLLYLLEKDTHSELGRTLLKKLRASQQTGPVDALLSALNHNSNEGQQFLEVVSKQRIELVELALQSFKRANEFERFFAALNDSTEKKAIHRLIGKSGSNADVAAGLSTLIRCLSDSEPTVVQTGRRAVQMLNNDIERDIAVAVLCNSSPTEYRSWLQEFDRGVSSTETQLAGKIAIMLDDGDSKSKIAARNMLSEIDRSSGAVCVIGAFLMNPDTTKIGINILSSRTLTQRLPLMLSVYSGKPLANEVLGLLNEDKVQNVEAVLEFHVVPGFNRAPDDEWGTLVQLSAHLETNDSSKFAKEILSRSKTPAQLMVLTGLLQDQSGRSCFEQLLNLERNPNRREIVQTAIETFNAPHQYREFVRLLNDPSSDEMVKSLVEMMRSETSAVTALSILRVLHDEKENRSHTIDLIKTLLADTDGLRLLELTLSNPTFSPRPFLDLACSQDFERAFQFMPEMLEDPKNAGAIIRLSNWLASPNPLLADDGRRILSMMNRRSTRADALNYLKRESEKQARAADQQGLQ